MTQKQNTGIPTELKQSDCSILLDEVKEKMNILKKCGMSEEEIISQLFCCQPLPKLIISRSYRIFLGEERKEVHLEPLVKSVYLLFLKHPEGIIFKDLPRMSLILCSTPSMRNAPESGELSLLCLIVAWQNIII